MLPQKAILTVPTDLKALDQVLSWFNRLHQNSIPKQDWLQCELALAEGFTNAVNHAHQDLPPEIPIKIEISFLETVLEIRIWDFGKPFDLQNHIRNLPPINNQEFGRGRGIPILLKVTDHLSYERTEDNRNCLLMVKNYSPRQVTRR